MFEKLIYSGIVFMGFFAIMNPLMAVSIFLALTVKESQDKIKNIAFKSTLTAFVIVVIFAVAGNLLLKLFGVSFTALRLVGGVVVALIGYDMLQGKQSAFIQSPNGTQKEEILEETSEKVGDEDSVAITPLGIPLLAGPGVIITAMNFSSGGFANLAITIGTFGLLCVITYFVFLSGKKIKTAIGEPAMKVITRMMGLILAVIGAQMLIEGTYSAIREFHSVNYFL